MQVIAVLTVPDDMHPSDALWALRCRCGDLEQELAVARLDGQASRIALDPLPSAPATVDAVILPRALSIGDLIVHSLKAISGG